MADTVPPKPALVHVGAEGGAIEVEVYELPMAAFGSFVVEVPAPLAIGSVTLGRRQVVKGFVAEPRAIDGRRGHHRTSAAGGLTSPGAERAGSARPLRHARNHILHRVRLTALGLSSGKS